MMQRKSIILLSIIAIISFGCESVINDESVIGSEYSSEELKILDEQLDIPNVPYSYSFGNVGGGVELDHKATLGRVLFYDKNLSANKEISCGSCHHQSLAFADNTAHSIGVDNKLTERNSMALGAFRSFGRQYDSSSDLRSIGLFWDERSGSIKEQLKETINNPTEMGTELDEIVDLLKREEYYQVLHAKAYDSEDVTEDHVLEALEMFINSISSVDTKLESEVIGELNYITGDSVVGNIENNLGLQLFVSHCGTCHQSGLDFLDDQSDDVNVTIANNGLVNTNNDLGIFEHTQDPKDIGKFKIPGLLNIELTAPYMHDGRFSSLEEVVEFYNSGIELSPNLHPALKQSNAAKRMHLNEEEKTALVDFLKLLTDQKITKEVKWSNPFI